MHLVPIWMTNSSLHFLPEYTITSIDWSRDILVQSELLASWGHRKIWFLQQLQFLYRIPPIGLPATVAQIKSNLLVLAWILSKS